MREPLQGITPFLVLDENQWTVYTTERQMVDVESLNLRLPKGQGFNTPDVEEMMGFARQADPETIIHFPQVLAFLASETAPLATEIPSSPNGHLSDRITAIRERDGHSSRFYSIDVLRVNEEPILDTGPEEPIKLGEVVVLKLSVDS